ncbi:MAG: hypothetical protein H7Z39_11060 [Burkholderiaceae bacterium]|nr:hypothetical protein [Burkholderiaceae bacterium]
MNEPIDLTRRPRNRIIDAPALVLVQLDPTEVVDGVPLEDDGYLADDFMIQGEMRETCPACPTEHLQMVLRQDNVKRAHLFCQRCTRCYDASYPDGTPAFAMA